MKNTPAGQLIATGPKINLRTIEESDLPRLADFPYSVRIDEPHNDRKRLQRLWSDHGFWTEIAGAVAIVAAQAKPVTEKSIPHTTDPLTPLTSPSPMLGTLHFYRSAPCIHGFEIGYVVHTQQSRNKGYASEGLLLLSNYLFEKHTEIYRHQLLIEVWNTASWKVAERAGFVREGIIRAAGFGEGEPADCFMYSRLKREHTQSSASSNGPSS